MENRPITVSDPRYPHRGTPVIAPTQGFNFVVIQGRLPERVTKAHSRYLSRVGFFAGVCPDYLTEKKAQDAAERCLSRHPNGKYRAVKITDTEDLRPIRRKYTPNE